MRAAAPAWSFPLNDLKWYEKPIKTEQLTALNKMLGEFTSDRKCRLFVISKLVKREIMSTKDLTIGEWGVIRDAAHPWWRDEGFTGDLDRYFRARVQLLVEQYQEEVLGQIRMF